MQNYKGIPAEFFIWISYLAEAIPIRSIPIFLIIDDFTIMRASKKAPDVGVQHQHNNKPNRPKYVNGQVCVALSMVLECGWINYALPLMARFARKQGNRNKLNAATLLVRVMQKAFSARITLLLDSWYMRGRLILSLFDYARHR